MGILSSKPIRRVKRLRRKRAKLGEQSGSFIVSQDSSASSFGVSTTSETVGGGRDELNARVERACHELHYTIWGDYFSAPITKKLQSGARVLELGCGLGFWSLAVAKMFPASTFIGLDISENFPTENLPRNLKFVQCNIFDGLPFEPLSFDYVRIGNILFGFTDKEWVLLFREICRMLKIGGIAETFDMDPLIYNPGILTTRLQNYMKAVFIGGKLILNLLEHVPDILNSTKQLVDIQYYERVVPLGKWGGPVGELNLDMTSMGYELFKPILLQACGVSEQEHNTLTQAFINEVEEEHSYLLTGRCYATKGL